VSRALAHFRLDDGFRSSPLARLVVDDELVIRAANDAYLAQVQRTEDEILDEPVFEVFPDNPGAEESDGPSAMADSFAKVLRTGRSHHLLVQRYDLLDRTTGDFRERYWVPVNVPVPRADRVVGVEVRVEEVRRPAGPAVRAVHALRDAITGGFLDADQDEAVVTRLAEAIREVDQLTREAGQLREALVSRAAIDQAKGIVMAQHGIGPDEAWDRLVKASNDTNVRVADVAAALVYQVSCGGTVGTPEPTS